MTLKDWLVIQRHFAEEVGEIAFYVAVVLLVIALIKLIPYRWFAKLHILRNLSAELINQWKDLAQQANVTFHYIPSETQRLSADHIVQSVQNSETRSLWLCGSRSFTNKQYCRKT